MASTAPVATLPVAGALVLRDRTQAEPLQVFVVAIDDLVAAGIWTTSNVRRGWRRRMVVALAPTATAPPELPEPLRWVDGALREATAALKDAPFAVESAARWMAVHLPRAPDHAVSRTIEELIARGLLTRTPSLTASGEGGVLLRKTPVPRTIHLFANERQARRAAMSALSPTGVTFVKAWIAALMLAETAPSNPHRDGDGEGGWGDWFSGDFGGGDGGGGD